MTFIINTISKMETECSKKNKIIQQLNTKTKARKQILWHEIVTADDDDHNDYGNQSSSEQNCIDSNDNDRYNYFCSIDEILQKIEIDIKKINEIILFDENYIKDLKLCLTELKSKLEKNALLMGYNFYPKFFKKYLCRRKNVSMKNIEEYVKMKMENIEEYVKMKMERFYE